MFSKLPDDVLWHFCVPFLEIFDLVRLQTVSRGSNLIQIKQQSPPKFSNNTVIVYNGSQTKTINSNGMKWLLKSAICVDAACLAGFFDLSGLHEEVELEVKLKLFCSHLQQVSFEHVCRYYYESVQFISLCVNLEEISFTNCAVVNILLMEVLPSFAATLKVVNLSGCINSTLTQPYQGLTLLPNMTTLNVSGCYFFLGETLCDIAVACPLLTSVDVSHCKMIATISLIWFAGKMHKLTVTLLECSRL